MSTYNVTQNVYMMLQLQDTQYIVSRKAICSFCQTEGSGAGSGSSITCFSHYSIKWDDATRELSGGAVSPCVNFST